MSGLAEAVVRATDETRLTGLVAAEAGRGDWRAATWLLERRYPERWAPIRRKPDGELEQTVDADDPFAEVEGAPSPAGASAAEVAWSRAFSSARTDRA